MCLPCTLQGVTYQHTQGVVKNIIPAIASTNAIVAAACTLEALKTITLCSTGMDNYMMWVLYSTPQRAAPARCRCALNLTSKGPCLVQSACAQSQPTLAQTIPQ